MTIRLLPGKLIDDLPVFVNNRMETPDIDMGHQILVKAQYIDTVEIRYRWKLNIDMLASDINELQGAMNSRVLDRAIRG